MTQLTQEQIDELTCPTCKEIGFGCVCEPSQEDKLAALYEAIANDRDPENGPQTIYPHEFGLECFCDQCEKEQQKP